MGSIPSSLASAPVRVVDRRDGAAHNLRFVAGLFGTTQDQVTGALKAESAGPSSTTRRTKALARAADLVGVCARVGRPHGIARAVRRIATLAARVRARGKGVCGRWTAEAILTLAASADGERFARTVTRLPSPYTGQGTRKCGHIFRYRALVDCLGQAAVARSSGTLRYFAHADALGIGIAGLVVVGGKDRAARIRVDSSIARRPVGRGRRPHVVRERAAVWTLEATERPAGIRRVRIAVLGAGRGLLRASDTSEDASPAGRGAGSSVVRRTCSRAKGAERSTERHQHPE